ARFFNADGTARTGEVQINQTTAGRQDLPTLERLADGSLIAAWRSYDATGQSFAIMGRRFDAQGNALGTEFQLSDARYTQSAAGDFSQPSLSARLDGGFVAYWQDPTPGANAFVSKVFAASNLTPVIEIQNGRLGYGETKSGTSLVTSTHAQGTQWRTSGLQQVGWYEFRDQTSAVGSGYFTVNGQAQPAGSVISVSAADVGQVVWHAGTGIGTDAIQVRGYDGRQWSAWTDAAWTTASTNGPLIAGTESRDVAANLVYEPLEQSYVASLTDGGYIKVWWTAEGNASDIYARRYNADGSAAGAAFLVNTNTSLNQGGATVTALSDGGYVIGWYSTNGAISGNTSAGSIWQQRFDAANTRIGGEQQVNSAASPSSERSWPTSATLSGGGWVTVWQSYNQASGSSYWDIYGQRFDAS
ncbi:hypothetical protein ACFSBS_10785, partial [Azospirillum griseum]